jgi:hypothetical protein
MIAAAVNTSPSWWQSVLAGAVGGALALAGVLIAQIFEGRRAEAKDRRTARARLAGRLREAYAPMVAFADLMSEVTRVDSFLFAGETVDGREERVAAEMRKGMNAIQAQLGYVLVEPNAQAVHETFMKVWAAVNLFYMERNDPHTGQERVTRLGVARGAVVKASSELAEAARRQLAELDPA